MGIKTMGADTGGNRTLETKNGDILELQTFILAHQIHIAFRFHIYHVPKLSRLQWLFWLLCFFFYLCYQGRQQHLISVFTVFEEFEWMKCGTSSYSIQSTSFQPMLPELIHAKSVLICLRAFKDSLMHFDSRICCAAYTKRGSEVRNS